MTCVCKSNRPQEQCHLPLVTEVYRPTNPQALRYALPPHVNSNQARFYAGRLSSGTGLTIDSSNHPTWALTQEGHDRPPFVLIPFLRGLVHDPELIVVRDAFRGVHAWPTVTSLTASERDATEQELIRISATWSVDDLHAFRTAFVKLLHFNNPQSLESGLGDLVLTLRTAFPQATLDVLRISPRSLADPNLVRILALMRLVEIPDLTRMLETPPDDPRKLVPFDIEPHYELLANLCYPRTFGFGVRLGPEVYLIVDYGQDVQLDAVEWSERRARDIGASLYTAPGSGLRTRSFPQMRPEDRHFLRAWLTRRLNFLLWHLCNLHGISPNAAGCIETVALWKDLLTVKDIVSLTQLIATSSDPTVIRLLFFDLIDRYGQLGGNTPKRKLDAILCDPFITAVGDSFGDDLLDLKPVAREYLMESWKRFVDGMWEGVLNPDARGARVVNVAPPSSPERLLAGSEFAGRMARVLRNTTHGYHLDHDAFENYLVRHSGDIPDSVRELSLALWLGLLASPGRFWPQANRFTGMDRVAIEPPELFRPGGADATRNLPPAEPAHGPARTN